jgi:hypothetical protein
LDPCFEISFEASEVVLSMEIKNLILIFILLTGMSLGVVYADDQTTVADSGKKVFSDHGFPVYPDPVYAGVTA